MDRGESRIGRPGGRRSRAGHTTIWFALGAVPVLFIIMCLSGDIGHMVYERSRLQCTADAATLAGIHVLVSQQAMGVNEETARAAAQAEAVQLAQENYSAAGLKVEFGRRGVSGAFEAVDVSARASAVKATAFRNGDAPGGPVTLAFAGILSGGNCEPAAAAAAEGALDIVAVREGLLPFCIPWDEHLSDLVGAGQPVKFYPCDGNLYDSVADKTSLPGCFGLLNLDGGNHSTTEIIGWITNGYPGTVELNEQTHSLLVQGTSGFRASMSSALQGRIGEEVVILLYDAAYNQGANALFNCIGFISGRLTTCRLTGKDPSIEFTVGGITLYRNVTAGHSAPSPNMRKIQLFE